MRCAPLVGLSLERRMEPALTSLNPRGNQMTVMETHPVFVCFFVVVVVFNNYDEQRAVPRL